MTPAMLLGIVALAAGICWLVALFERIANGSPAERREYEAERAKADMEALLRGEA